MGDMTLVLKLFGMAAPQPLASSCGRPFLEVLNGSRWSMVLAHIVYMLVD